MTQIKPDNQLLEPQLFWMKNYFLNYFIVVYEVSILLMFNKH